MQYTGNNNYLNNDYETKIVYKSANYRNATAAILAQKTPHNAQRKKFQNLTASEAKAYSDTLPIRKTWDAIKDDVEQEVLSAKFEQNPDIQKRLASLVDSLYDGYPSHKHQAEILEMLRQEYTPGKQKTPGVYVTDEIQPKTKGFTRILDLNKAEDHGLNLGKDLTEFKHTLTEAGTFEEKREEEFIPSYLKRLKTKDAVNHLNTIWKDTARGAESVLLISQDEDVRTVLATLLERAGCPVIHLDRTESVPAYADQYFG